jgi:hypothetical protein
MQLENVNKIKSNQIKSNQIKSNQIRYMHVHTIGEKRNKNGYSDA